MSSLLITDVRMVDPRGWVLEGDLFIRGGIIEAVGKRLSFDVPAIRGEGRTLLPAFVDLHAHFRDPGFPEKEDLLSGSMAAVKGGYTAVSVMANTNPVCDNPEVAKYIHDKAKQVGLLEINPVGAITKGLLGEELSDMAALAPYVWAFSDDGKGVERHDLMHKAAQAAFSLGRPILSHCEFSGLDRALSEELMAGRDIWLCRRIGFHLHLTHLSTKGALELVGLAKEWGLPVTSEVTPHHLCLAREEVDYSVNPPLPDRTTQEALIQALKIGKIDAIATDHAPHTQEDKAQGAPGISGIETAFSLLYTRLVKPGILSLPELSRRISLEPARILGQKLGTIQVGYNGDVVLVEEDESFMVTREFFYSKGTNSPLLGTKLLGKVWATVHRGEVIYLDGKVKGRDFDDYRQVVRGG